MNILTLFGKNYNYYLMHKDIPVQEVHIRDGKYESSSEVFNKKHFPPGYRDFESWWDLRAVPSNREGGTKPSRFVDMERSFALSLSDCYWIKPVGTKYKWSSVNYYDNSFKTLSVNTLGVDRDPDTTSDGYLKKSWEWVEHPRLIKFYSTLNGLSQNKREIIVSKLYESILCEGFVQYKNTKFGAICDCFCGTDSEFITARELGWNTYDVFKSGLKCGQDLFDLMLVIDYLTFQEDRHLNNFGILRNPDTLEIQSFAPIFDNGKCLFTGQLGKIETPICKPFNRDRYKQIQLVDIKKLTTVLSKLDISYLCGLIDKYIPETDMIPQIQHAVRKSYEDVVKLMEAV